MNISTLLCLLVVCVSGLWAVLGKTKPKGSTTMKLKNLTGRSVEVFWINVFTPARDLVPQTEKPIRNGTDSTINSYHTHAFQIKFAAGAHVEFTEAEFAKGPEDEDIFITFDEAANKIQVSQKTPMEQLRDKVEESSIKCAAESSGTIFGMNMTNLVGCIADDVTQDLSDVSQRATTVSDQRDLIASRLRNYTCADPSMKSSEPEESYNFHLHNTKRTIRVDSLLDKPHAKIWLAHDFITPDECKILMDHGRPKLMRATVAGDDGTSVVSDNRKAQQANYALSGKEDPLYALYDRVFALTNHHTNYGLKLEGQEDFTIIQYNPSDEYTPHCDGACDGTPHVRTGRVASAVMYCKVAEQGGATTFTNQDIFVKPENGMATFFSYKDKKSGKMDDGDTQHSGCPVLEGEKWITTVWMRDGVTAQDPWQLYDPSGMRMTDEVHVEAQQVSGEL